MSFIHVLMLQYTDSLHPICCSRQKDNVSDGKNCVLGAGRCSNDWLYRVRAETNLSLMPSSGWKQYNFQLLLCPCLKTSTLSYVIFILSALSILQVQYLAQKCFLWWQMYFIGVIWWYVAWLIDRCTSPRATEALDSCVAQSCFVLTVTQCGAHYSCSSVLLILITKAAYYPDVITSINQGSQN